MTNWNTVSERLPQLMEYVLVHDPDFDGPYLVASRNQYGEWYSDDEELEPTHWMDLPGPPETNKVVTTDRMDELLRENPERLETDEDNAN